MSAPFEDRMSAEHKQLSGRISKLSDFLDTPLFATLSDVDKDLLNAQLGAMQVYQSVLNMRIRRSYSR